MLFFPLKTARECKATHKSGTSTSPPSCCKVIPVYPLRYAVVPKDAPGNDYDLPSLEKDAFPSLEGSRYVLRPLRYNRGYVYIFDPKHPEKVIAFVYCTKRLIENPLFWRLQIDDEGRHSFIISGLAEEQEPDSKDWGNPFPYIPTFTHEPETVSFLFSDFPLGKEQLDDFKKSGDSEIRQKSAVDIPLRKWIDAARSGAADPTDVRHTLGISAIPAQAFGFREEEGISFWEELDFSEYGMKVTLPTRQILDIVRGSNTPAPFPALAVVLPDPIGLMSELNTSAARINARYIAYTSESARKLRASDGVELFLKEARRQIEEKKKKYPYFADFNKEDACKRLLRGRRYETLRGEEKKLVDEHLKRMEANHKKRLETPLSRRLDYVRDDERKTFLREHTQKLQELGEELKPCSRDILAYDTACAPWSWRTAAETLYDRLNTDGYIAFRATLARCLQGFVLEPEGVQRLTDMLPVEGEPEELFSLLVAPETAVGKYIIDVKAEMQQGGSSAGHVEPRKGPPLGDVFAGAAGTLTILAQKRLDMLMKLLETVPADNASRMLAEAIAHANAKYARRAGSLKVLFRENSTTHILLETTTQQLAYKKTLTASEVPEAIIAMAGDQKGFPHPSRVQLYGARFKSVAVPKGKIGDLVMVVRIRDTLPLKPSHPALAFWSTPKVWNNVKVGALGLGLLGSLYNAAVAFETLGEKDGQALAKCLNFGHEIALASSTPYLMKEVMKHGSTTGFLAGRAAMRFVGAAALCMLTKDILDARNQHGTVQNLSVADMVVQTAVLGTAAYYLAATAMKVSVNAALFGPGGLIVFALATISFAIKIWQEQEKKEQRITDWLNRCAWGRALPSESWISTQETKPYDDQDEMKELFRILHTPIMIRRRLGGEAGLMRLEVLLPDWRPQLSAYELRIEMRPFSSEPKKVPPLDNPDLVHDEGNGFGRLTVTAGSLEVPDGYLNNEGIDYAVLRYWPNKVTAPDDFVETPPLMN